MTHIRFCPLDDDSVMALPQAQALLSTDEQARADRFHFDIHRQRFIRGRGFLRQSLSAALGKAADKLDFDTGPHGKPGLADEMLHFNLSHSEGMAVLAIAPTPVGIDIEYTTRASDLGKLATRVFTPAEQDVLSLLTGDAHARCFFAFWTAKEARMKLTGEGMSLAPEQIALHLEDGLPTGFDRPATPQAELSYPDTPDTNLICALASSPEGLL